MLHCGTAAHPNSSAKHRDTVRLSTPKKEPNVHCVTTTDLAESKVFYVKNKSPLLDAAWPCPSCVACSCCSPSFCPWEKLIIWQPPWQASPEQLVLPAALPPALCQPAPCHGALENAAGLHYLRNPVLRKWHRNVSSTHLSSSPCRVDFPLPLVTAITAVQAPKGLQPIWITTLISTNDLSGQEGQPTPPDVPRELWDSV